MRCKAPPRDAAPATVQHGDRAAMSGDEPMVMGSPGTASASGSSTAAAAHAGHVVACSTASEYATQPCETLRTGAMQRSSGHHRHRSRGRIPHTEAALWALQASVTGRKRILADCDAYELGEPRTSSGPPQRGALDWGQAPEGGSCAVTRHEVMRTATAARSPPEAWSASPAPSADRELIESSMDGSNDWRCSDHATKIRRTMLCNGDSDPDDTDRESDEWAVRPSEGVVRQRSDWGSDTKEANYRSRHGGVGRDAAGRGGNFGIGSCAGGALSNGITHADTTNSTIANDAAGYGGGGGGDGHGDMVSDGNDDGAAERLGNLNRFFWSDAESRVRNRPPPHDVYRLGMAAVLGRWRPDNGAACANHLLMGWQARFAPATLDAAWQPSLLDNSMPVRNFLLDALYAVITPNSSTAPRSCTRTTGYAYDVEGCVLLLRCFVGALESDQRASGNNAGASSAVQRMLHENASGRDIRALCPSLVEYCYSPTARRDIVDCLQRFLHVVRGPLQCADA